MAKQGRGSVLAAAGATAAGARHAGMWAGTYAPVLPRESSLWAGRCCRCPLRACPAGASKWMSSCATCCCRAVRCCAWLPASLPKIAGAADTELCSEPSPAAEAGLLPPLQTEPPAGAGPTEPLASLRALPASDACRRSCAGVGAGPCGCAAAVAAGGFAVPANAARSEPACAGCSSGAAAAERAYPMRLRITFLRRPGGTPASVCATSAVESGTSGTPKGAPPAECSKEAGTAGGGAGLPLCASECCITTGAAAAAGGGAEPAAAATGSGSADRLVNRSSSKASLQGVSSTAKSTRSILADRHHPAQRLQLAIALQTCEQLQAAEGSVSHARRGSKGVLCSCVESIGRSWCGAAAQPVSIASLGSSGRLSGCLSGGQ
jgi:hypothetical protein